MAAGTGDLRDIAQHDMEPFLIFVRESWLKITTNSQLAELWVNDSNKCIFMSKDEKISNIYAIVMSRTVMCLIDNTSTDHKN